MATRTITEGVSIARRRRLSETYIGDWIMTTDHKKLGIMYMVTAFFFFLVGGVDALLIRTQLAQPDGKVLSPEVYNQIFTMHAVTMIFLFIMPMLTGLGNYIVPLMIGARDYQLAIPGEILLAFGMGICNAAVFKMVPQAVPKAVGGAAGWVGGLGAFGGFAIPPILAFAVRDLGKPGYSIGFVVYLFLALLSLFMVWILKYSEAESAEAVPQVHKVPA